MCSRNNRRDIVIDSFQGRGAATPKGGTEEVGNYPLTVPFSPFSFPPDGFPHAAALYLPAFPCDQDQKILATTHYGAVKAYIYVFLCGFTHRVGDGTLERVLPCGFKDSNGLFLVSARAGVDSGASTFL